MSDGGDQGDRHEEARFAEAADREQVGFFSEFLDFLLHNKKWWITPIVIVLMLVGFLVMLGGTAAAPFIYTLF